MLPSTCYSTCATHPPHATPSYPLDAAGVEKITLLRFFAPQRKLAVGPREGEGDCRGVQGCTRVYKGDCRGVKSGNRVPYPRVALMYHHPMGEGGILVVGREATTPLKIWETVDIENHAREKVT